MMDGSGEDNAEADYHSLVIRSAGEYVRTVEGETEPNKSGIHMFSSYQMPC